MFFYRLKIFLLQMIDLETEYTPKINDTKIKLKSFS